MIAINASYKPTENLLTDKIILVTGASRGIGRAIAKTYARYGATVILLARSVKLLSSLYDEIESLGGPTPAIYPFNLTNATPQDYEDLKDNIQNHFGRLDGLVHNAALLGTLTPIEHYPIEQWYQVLQTNLHSPFLLTRAVISLLKMASNASIIFTGANEGLKGKAYWGAYGVSKFGLMGLAQTLAEELESNTTIRVNCINPVRSRTQLRASAYPGENSKKNTMPENMIDYYLYLMGDDSLGVTGETVTIGHNKIEIVEVN